MYRTLAYLAAAGLLFGVAGTHTSPRAHAEDPNDLKQQFQKLQVELLKTKEALEQERQQNQKLQLVSKDLQALTNKQRVEAEELKAKLEKTQQLAEQAKKVAEAEREKALLEAKKAQDQAELLKVQFKEELNLIQKKLQEMQLEAKKTAIEREALLQKLQQENVELKKAVADLRQKLQGQPNPPALPLPEALKKNPPAAFVKGMVQKIADDGTLLINLGSDHGLAPGHTLEVFRLQPQPKYLGVIQIVEVKAMQAVARPIGLAKNADIKTGDQVASGLLEKF